MEEKKSIITVPFMIAILSCIGGIASYFFIDGKIPIQWDINFEVSSYAPKETVFLMSAMPLIVYLALASRIVAGRNNKYGQKGSRVMLYACTYLIIFVQWMSIGSAIKPDLNVQLILPCVIGFVILIISNFMPTVQRNRMLGFRTYWSVRSDLSWKKTNRIGAYLMSIVGILLIVSGIFQTKVLYYVTVVVLVIAITIGFYISYYYWKKDENKDLKGRRV